MRLCPDCMCPETVGGGPHTCAGKMRKHSEEMKKYEGYTRHGPTPSSGAITTPVDTRHPNDRLDDLQKEVRTEIAALRRRVEALERKKKR